MKYFTIYTILFFTSFYTSIAQEIQVLSQEDNSPIPFANIVYMIKDSIVGGTYTNENGRLYLSLTDKVSHIEISCLGYESKKIEKNKINESIYLIDSVSELSEIVLKKKKKSKKQIKKMGFPIKYKGFSVDVAGGFQKVILIENIFKENKKIKSFLFRSVKWQNVSTVFKLLVYTNNNNKPDKPLIKTNKESCFILAPHQERIKLDISGLNIILPKEGIFVGIEYVGIVDSNKNIIVPSKTDYDADTHTSISFLKSKEKNAMYIFEKNKYNNNRDWQNINDYKDTRFPDLKQNEYYVPAFGIEVYE